MGNKIKKNKGNNKSEFNWIVLTTLLAFIVSALLAIVSELLIPEVSVLVNVIIIILFIAINIISDTIGVAIQSAEIKVFNSMSAKKLKGAKTAINLIKNKEKVSSFCSDVIGDICGVLSGTSGLTIAYRLSVLFNANIVISVALITSIITAFTIAGKALGKMYAAEKNNELIYKVVKVLGIFSKN